MLTYIILGSNENYKISGSGMSFAVMLVAGSVDIIDSNNNVMATLDDEGEAYPFVDKDFTIKGKASTNKVVIGSFPVLL